MANHKKLRSGIHPESHTSERGEAEMYAALERADRLRRRRDSMRSVFIAFIVIPIVVTLIIVAILN